MKNIRTLRNKRSRDRSRSSRSAYRHPDVTAGMLVLHPPIIAASSDFPSQFIGSSGGSTPFSVEAAKTYGLADVVVYSAVAKGKEGGYYSVRARSLFEPNPLVISSEDETVVENNATVYFELQGFDSPTAMEGLRRLTRGLLSGRIGAALSYIVVTFTQCQGSTLTQDGGLLTDSGDWIITDRSYGLALSAALRGVSGCHCFGPPLYWSQGEAVTPDLVRFVKNYAGPCSIHDSWCFATSGYALDCSDADYLRPVTSATDVFQVMSAVRNVFGYTIGNVQPVSQVDGRVITPSFGAKLDEVKAVYLALQGVYRTHLKGAAISDSIRLRDEYGFFRMHQFKEAFEFDKQATESSITVIVQRAIDYLSSLLKSLQSAPAASVQRTSREATNQVRNRRSRSRRHKLPPLAAVDDKE